MNILIIIFVLVIKFEVYNNKYKSKREDCKNFLLKNQCTESKNNTKIVTRYVWEKYIEETEDIRHPKGIHTTYKLRSQYLQM